MGSVDLHRLRHLTDRQALKAAIEWQDNPNPRAQWWLDAECRETPKNAFYGMVIRPEILELCERCPVRVDCLTDAMGYVTNDDEGMRAGTNAGDRAVMLRMRREVVA